jgi:hypothetical protein
MGWTKFRDRECVIFFCIYFGCIYILESTGDKSYENDIRRIKKNY